MYLQYKIFLFLSKQRIILKLVNSVQYCKKLFNYSLLIYINDLKIRAIFLKKKKTIRKIVEIGETDSNLRRLNFRNRKYFSIKWTKIDLRENKDKFRVLKKNYSFIKIFQ